MKKLLLSTTIISSLLGGAAHADYTDEGTDYRNDLASQESWTEDLSNKFLELPNSFACIIANSGSSVNANADWQALISEVACGLEDPNDNVDATVYSSAAMSSSRASNDTPQEVNAWFNALTGDRYITSSILRASAETLAPYGSWYFSFILAGDDESETELTADDTPEFGYVDISETDEGDVEIKTAQTFSGDDEYGSFEGTMRALIRFIDGSSENTVFIGESDDSFTDAGSGQTFESYSAVAGQTSATHYYRVNLGGSEDNPTIEEGSAVCYSRDDQFETAYDVKLYNPTTGDAVEMMSGFDITTAEGSRGYFGRWGVWVDSDAVLFTPETNTNAATKEDDGTAATLKWAPGKLELETYVEEALADGDTFDTWLDQIGSEAVLTWSAVDEAFSYTTRDGEQQGVVEPPEWGMWMWSMAKRTSVIWNGENTIEIRRVEDTLWTDEHTAAASTKFYSKWEWTDLSDPEMLPVSYSEFAQNGDRNFWDNQSVDQGGTNGVRKTYHLTGAEPGAGFEPNTLYMDTGDGELSADDKPVRFDFGIDNSQSTYVSYADGSSDEYTQPESGSWPHRNVNLIKATDVGESGSCTLNATYECPTYSWSFGAMPWDQSVTAYDADDARIELDEELVFQLEYDSSNDRNKDVTISLSTMDMRNPIPGCSIETGEGDDGEYQYYQCTDITVDLADGEKFFLNYDGQRLHGLPGTEVCDTPDCSSGNGYWMHLLNLADGTTITDLEGNQYVTLAGATSSQLITADAASCGGIAFDSLAEIGLDDSSQYPQIERASEDYPLPTVAWGDQPTELSCTVTMGDTSDCVSE